VLAQAGVVRLRSYRLQVLGAAVDFVVRHFDFVSIATAVEQVLARQSDGHH